MNFMQIIDNDSGMHVRPMFRVIDVKASGTAVINHYLLTFTYRVTFFSC